MRNSLTSGAVIEAAVTVLVAILMTMAGLEMLMGAADDAALALRPGSVVDAVSTLPIGEAIRTVVVESIRWPHVDVAQV